ncbi:hypothetical protein PsorP6_003025 [Peronosclerospora sorghi]|uniref:Uncharacterized protein n=1 Tax=Peronosclerospora sorghi TaxID=230839 RepID=A0ACC0VQG0_9STRA|nr:hypothetical protein PsorP6_003025 [Peronosclerospora sorghi]
MAVKQWARRRLEAIEEDVHEIINEQQPRRRDLPCTEAMEEYLRHSNGLHTVLIALTERLQEGSFQAAYSSKGEHQAAAASDEYIFFYREARALRVTYREQFEKITARNFHMSVDQRNQCCGLIAWCKAREFQFRTG